MQLKTFELKKNLPFQMYLLSNLLVKKINKEFSFYNVRIYRKEKVKTHTVCLDYPKGNMYWFVDFKKFIIKEILSKDNMYETEWKWMLNEIRLDIKKDFDALNNELTYIDRKKVVSKMLEYNLRDYQAFDLEQLLIKMRYSECNSGLLLSEQRTGKTRVALATVIETLKPGGTCLIVCPKSAQIGWLDEILKMHTHMKSTIFVGGAVNKISDIKNFEKEWHPTALNVRIMSYDLFKKLTLPQIKSLICYSKTRELMVVGDEVHRLRNFKTLQSNALFSLKDIAKKYRINLSLLGLSGTPAVKESSDVFGSLSFINNSKIKFQPYWDSFNEFKEYFYVCEDTSFGKICKALKREDELNFILRTCSIQTRQKELELFKNYTKKYLKFEIPMDDEQKVIYEAVRDEMEFGEDIDCENKLVQLIRLQQICIDPKGLVAAYELTSPKIKWILDFINKNPKLKFIVMAKKVQPLRHLKELFDEKCIKYSFLKGGMSLEDRKKEIENFKTESNVFLIQQDTGKESLTLPEAFATIFLDRDFAQGYNEQAEARMTPVNGATCTKYVIDLIMKGTKEEEIYNTLVVKKESITSVNQVFRKEEV